MAMVCVLTLSAQGIYDFKVYTWLKAQKGFSGFDAGNDKNPDIKWNFTKFLVSRDGRVLKRYEPTDKMADIEADIAAIF